MSRGKIIVTGATGYIGARVVEALSARGWSVEAWTRRRPAGDGLWRAYALSDEVLPDASGAAAIIHLAAETGGGVDLTQEQLAAQRLARAAQSAGARLLFASSQTALNPGSDYGLAKRAIEEIVADVNGVSVRLGLVYGRRRLGGVFAMLVGVMRRLPAVPMILPAPRVQPVHVDDVAEAFCALLERPQLTGAIHLGGEGVAFHSFLAEITRRRHGRAPLFVPIPRFALTVMLAIAPRELAARAHSLLSLQAMPAHEAQTQLGLSLRPWREWLAASTTPRRRALLREGKALLQHASGRASSFAAARRYARAVEQLSAGQPLDLPATVLGVPWLLGLIERPVLRGRSALEERLDWALSLAEATPNGARAFDHAPKGFLAACFDLTGAVIGEAMRRAFGWLARLMLPASLRSAPQ